MTCTYIVMHLSICQLPSCNLFTQHVSYLPWRDTTSELWTPVHSFTSEYIIYCKHCSLYFLQANIIFHTICLILCFQQASEIDNLTVRGKVSWLCCVQVPRQSVKLTPSKALLSPTSSITLVSY